MRSLHHSSLMRWWEQHICIHLSPSLGHSSSFAAICLWPKPEKSIWMVFNKGKCWVLLWALNYPMRQYRLSKEWLESCPAEQDPEAAGWRKATSVHWWSRRSMCPGLHQKQHSSRTGCILVCGTSETTPRVLGWALCPSLQEDTELLECKWRALKLVKKQVSWGATEGIGDV